MNYAMKRLGLAAAVLGLLAGVAGRSEAALMTYTSSSAFNAAIAGYSTSIENYSGFVAGTPINAGQSFHGLTYSAFVPGPSGTLLGGIITDAFNSFTGVSLGGRQSGGQQFFFGGDSVTVTFANPVNAFGVFLNVNPNSGTYSITTPLGSATTDSATYDTSTFVFAGLVSTGQKFTSATISSQSTSLGVYNVPEIITATVPEPASLAVMGLGLAAVAGLSWHRRRLA